MRVLTELLGPGRIEDLHDDLPSVDFNELAV